MKIRYLLLAASLLLSPTLVLASDNLKHGSLAILSLRQLSDLSRDPLPQDILNLVGQTLTELEHHGVWLDKGVGKKWIPFTNIVAEMQTFRDAKLSKAKVKAVLKGKEQVKKGLLFVLSSQWDEGLEGLMKEHKQQEGQWNPGKAYAAAFLAYYTIELSAVRIAAWDAAWENASNIAWETASNAAWRDAYRAAYVPTWRAAYNAARYAAWDLAKDAAKNAFRPSLKQKLKSLSCRSGYRLGVNSYDLAELFSLLWLTENGHDYLKQTFDAVYAQIPEMEISGVKAMIKASIDAAAIENLKLADNMFIKALWRDLDAAEKFVLAQQ